MNKFTVFSVPCHFYSPGLAIFYAPAENRLFAVLKLKACYYFSVRKDLH